MHNTCIHGVSVYASDVVLETKVLVSRSREDKQENLGVGLDKKILRIFKTFPFSNS